MLMAGGCTEIIWRGDRHQRAGGTVVAYRERTLRRLFAPAAARRRNWDQKGFQVGLGVNLR